MTMAEGVKNFLQNLGLVKYLDIFSAKGFDLESDIPHLTETDLKETLMVTCDEEREIILYSAQRFKTSSEHFVYEWLRRNSLDYYFVNFIQSGFVNLDLVSNVKLPNEEIYDELEIVLPGHRKRLERAVANLRQEIQRRSVAEKPVTQGWWGKPECLPQAKFDFLCVEGSLFARHEPNRRVKIDFMVDSGSDVSTVQEKTLDLLNLELVGTVYSCGIHGGNHTNLYRAQLQIGGEQMTVEVIASNYDSLGSRIVRHFRHVIDGNRHIWLKGNYRDPIPAVLPLKVPETTKPQESKSQILSIEDGNNYSTASPSNVSSILSNEKKDTMSASKVIPSLPSPLSNSFTNSSISHKSLPTSVVNVSMMNNVISPSDDKSKSDLDAGNSQNKSSFISDKSDISQGLRNKRALESCEREISNCSEEIHGSKVIKLDQNAKDLPNHSSVSSLQQPLSSTSISNVQESHNPHQHISNISQHIPNNPAISNTGSFQLGNTDDDVDHMDSDKIYAKYSTSYRSSSSFSSDTQLHSNQINSRNIDLSNYSDIQAHSITANNGEIRSNIENFQADIIHVHSDDEDDDFIGCSNDNNVVHIHEKLEPGVKTGAFSTFSRNFIPGNNSSSVTLSMVDLNEQEEVE